MPCILDCGTNREDLLKDPYYLVRARILRPNKERLLRFPPFFFFFSLLSYFFSCGFV